MKLRLSDLKEMFLKMRDAVEQTRPCARYFRRH
jgi:hypothetical protein